MNKEEIVKQLLLDKYGINVESGNTCFIMQKDYITEEHSIKKGNIGIVKDFWLKHNNESDCCKFVLKVDFLDLNNNDAIEYFVEFIEADSVSFTFEADTFNKTIRIVDESDATSTLTDVNCVWNILSENDAVALEIRDLRNCLYRFSRAKYDYIKEDFEKYSGGKIADIISKILSVVFLVAGFVVDSPWLFWVVVISVVGLNFLVISDTMRKNENKPDKPDYEETEEGKRQVSKISLLAQSIAKEIKECA